MKPFDGADYGEHFELETMVPHFRLVRCLTKIRHRLPSYSSASVAGLPPGPSYSRRCAVCSVSTEGSYRHNAGEEVSSSFNVSKAFSHSSSNIKSVSFFNN